MMRGLCASALSAADRHTEQAAEGGAGKGKLQGDPAVIAGVGGFLRGGEDGIGFGNFLGQSLVLEIFAADVAVSEFDIAVFGGGGGATAAVG